MHDTGNSVKLLQNVNSINYERFPFLCPLCPHSASFKNSTSERSQDFIWSNVTQQPCLAVSFSSQILTPYQMAQVHSPHKQLRSHEECTFSGLTTCPPQVSHSSHWASLLCPPSRMSCNPQTQRPAASPLCWYRARRVTRCASRCPQSQSRRAL